MSKEEFLNDNPFLVVTMGMAPAKDGQWFVYEKWQNQPGTTLFGPMAPELVQPFIEERQAILRHEIGRLISRQKQAPDVITDKSKLN